MVHALFSGFSGPSSSPDLGQVTVFRGTSNFKGAAYTLTVPLPTLEYTRVLCNCRLTWQNAVKQHLMDYNSIPADQFKLQKQELTLEAFEPLEWKVFTVSFVH